MVSAFTPLERAVLVAVFEAYPEDRAALEAQLATAAVRSRENTGCGFFTHFSVDPSSSAPIGGLRLRDGPAAKGDGLMHGMGFILWLENGRADCLEGGGRIYDRDCPENGRIRNSQRAGRNPASDRGPILNPVVEPDGDYADR
jgi:hypothetical protein